MRRPAFSWPKDTQIIVNKTRKQKNTKALYQTLESNSSGIKPAGSGFTAISWRTLEIGSNKTFASSTLYSASS